MEKDSLKEATCELIRETRATNSLLRQMLDKFEPAKGYPEFKADEQAFLEWWNHLPFRDTIHPLAAARQAWSQAIAYQICKERL